MCPLNEMIKPDPFLFRTACAILWTRRTPVNRRDIPPYSKPPRISRKVFKVRPLSTDTSSGAEGGRLPRALIEEDSLAGEVTLKAGALGFCALSLLFVGALPAAAQAPVEVGGPVIEEVDKITDGPVDVVEEIVEEPTGPVEEIVKETEQVVDETVTKVEDGVEEVVSQPLLGTDPESPTQPGPSDPSDPSDPTTPQPGDKTPTGGSNSGRNGPEARRSDRVLSTFAARGGRDNGAVDGRSTIIEPVLPRIAALEEAPQASAMDRFPPSSPLTPAEAAQRLAFPIAMTGAVVLFLLLQGRFDRRDPKLMLDVDLSGDGLSFE